MSSTDTIATALLGEFAVSVNGALIAAERWKFKHPRLLWQMLCLAPGHCVSRDEAAEALWPQATVQASSNRLYHTLHTLRGIFSDVGLADARQLVQLQAGTLRLHPALTLDVDVQRFAQAVADARACSGSDAALAHLECAHEIHRGAFAVPPAAGDWFAPHRQTLRRDQVWVFERLAERYLAADRIDDAVQICQAIVLAEPGNEAAHRRLIELYDAQGRPDLVAQQYTACSRYLRRDLGTEPSLATRQLAERITTRAGERAVLRAPAEAPARSRFVAPQRATPLLGRESELSELRQWLQSSEGSRLITIAAAGGVGKTRLAAALAEQVQDDFADGVQFIALGNVQRPSRLAERVCQALGLSPAEQPADQFLPAALASRHRLLVLDRFEHLIEAAPQLALWLQAAPRLHIVVTSQCPLKSRAERVYELLPLTVRAPRAAIELFAQTARRAGAEVDVPRSEALILGLCESIGGNALAIELAAAQSSGMPVGDLAAALASAPLQFLAGHSTDGEPQHVSLQATIEWSCSLLTPAEATALVLTSVFAHDFSAEDAQAVLGDLIDADSLRRTLRLLVERHLLVGSIDESHEGLRRFAMLDAVRAFARRVALADDRWAQVCERHALHFHRLAETTWQGVSQGRVGEVRSAFVAAAADINASLSWMREHASAEDYLRGCWQRAAPLMMFGLLQEALDSLYQAKRVAVQSAGERGQSAWCHYMLSRAEVFAGNPRAAMQPIRAARFLAKHSTEEALLGGRIDRQQARLALGQLRLGMARRLTDKLISHAQRLEQWDLLSLAYGESSLCSSMSGDYRAASERLELAIDHALRARDTELTLLALLGLASVETSRGLLDRTQDAVRECAAVANAGDAVYVQLHLLLIEGELAFERACFDDAHRHFSNALEHCRSTLQARALVARLWHDILLVEQGRPLEAAALRGLSARELAFDSDFSDFFFRVLNYQARLLAGHREWSAARTTLARIEPLVMRTGNPLWLSWLAESAAVVAHELGRGELAQNLLARSITLQQQHGFIATPRQKASWARHDACFRQTLPRCGSTAADVLVAMLQQLALDIEPSTRKQTQPAQRDAIGSA
jgi:DNA-binding SARP family transcriptional activator